MAIHEPPSVGLRLAAHNHVLNHWLACKQQRPLSKATHGRHRSKQCGGHAGPSYGALGSSRGRVVWRAGATFGVALQSGSTKLLDFGVNVVLLWV